MSEVRGKGTDFYWPVLLYNHYFLQFSTHTTKWRPYNMIQYRFSEIAFLSLKCVFISYLKDKWDLPLIYSDIVFQQKNDIGGVIFSLSGKSLIQHSAGELWYWIEGNYNFTLILNFFLPQVTTLSRGFCLNLAFNGWTNSQNRTFAVCVKKQTINAR